MNALWVWTKGEASTFDVITINLCKKGKYVVFMCELINVRLTIKLWAAFWFYGIHGATAEIKDVKTKYLEK